MAINRSRFQLGDWLVDAEICELHSIRGENVSVQPRVMDVLLCLANADGRVVSRQELIETVWEGRPTSDEPINRCIAELRSALGDDRSNPTYIRTVPKRGYQLLPEVRPVADDSITHGSSTRELLGWALYAGLGVAALLSWWFLSTPQQDQNVSPQILVLPLSPLSEDTKLLADALTEELLNTLAQSPDLLVFSRTVTFSASGTDRTPMDIARSVDADLILEGGVRVDQERVRITAQLIDASSDIHVFSREFEYSKADVESLIPDISRMIAAEVGQTLPLREHQKELRQLDFEAYRDFVEASSLIRRFQDRLRDRDALDGAISRLQAVIARYPDYAPAHAYVAVAYNSYYHFFSQDPEHRKQRDVHLQRALELNPDEPYALALQVLGEPQAEVIRVFRQVVVADPGLTSTRFGLGMRLARAGYLAEAVDELSWLRKREPLATLYNFREALPQLALQHYDEVAERRQRLLELDQDSMAAWLSLLLALQDADAEAAAAAWPAFKGYDEQPHSGLTAEDVRAFVNASASQRECRLIADEHLADSLDDAPQYLRFLFLSASPACAEQALDMRFDNRGALPNFDIPYLFWLPQAAHLRTNPRFHELTEQFELPTTWRELGAPDLCEERDGNFICH